MFLAVKSEHTEDDAGLWNLHAFLALRQDLDSHPTLSLASIATSASNISFLTSLNLGLAPHLRLSGHPCSLL